MMVAGFTFADELYSASGYGPKLVFDSSTKVEFTPDGYVITPVLANATDVDIHAHQAQANFVAETNLDSNYIKNRLDRLASYVISGRGLQIEQPFPISKGFAVSLEKGSPIPAYLMQDDQKYLLILAIYAPHAHPLRVWGTALCLKLTQPFTPTTTHIEKFTVCPGNDPYYSAWAWDLDRKTRDVLGLGKR
jgi:hypothetical protein